MSLNPNWQVKIRENVYKDIERFPQKDKTRILGVIKNVVLSPFLGDVEKMKGEENVWRRRVGAYRIFYEILPKEKVIYIFHIERRTSKTY